MTTARDQLKQMGYPTLEAAEDALDPAVHNFQPCAYGHLECAYRDGGPCLGEVWAVLSAAREEQETELVAALTPLDEQTIRGCACGAQEMAGEIREMIRTSPGLAAYRKTQLAEWAKRLDGLYPRLSQVADRMTSTSW